MTDEVYKLLTAPRRTYSKDRKHEFDTRKWYEYADLKGEI